MLPISSRLAAIAFAALAAAPLGALVAPAQASEIKAVVNGVPVTSYDIERRAAFLKLQRQKGDLRAKAEEQMIDQALRLAEMRRMGVRVGQDQVDAAYTRFAASNKMTASQLDTILDRSGVTKAHFKDYIRASMGWGQVVAAKSRAPGGGMSEQDVAQRMLKQGGAKPTATEYMLQQVIFVVPAKERAARLAARRREAEQMRTRFNGCNTTRDFAKGLVDVTVRDLGRKYAPELPSDWSEQIKATKPGAATVVRETERGVEFIGICSAREVSDDKVAQLVFQTEGQDGKPGEKGADDPGKTFLDQLRQKAKIERR